MLISRWLRKCGCLSYPGQSIMGSIDECCTNLNGLRAFPDEKGSRFDAEMLIRADPYDKPLPSRMIYLPFPAA